MVWAAIIKDELVGPFQVEDGLNFSYQNYCQFLEDNFFLFKESISAQEDNAPLLG